MPMTGSSTYALVIVSLGILGIILSFLVADKKKSYVALGLSVLVICMGFFSSFQTWMMRRRIARLQQTERLNLETFQAHLREAMEKGRNGGKGAAPAGTAAPAPAATTAPAPAAVRPASSGRRRR